MEDLEGLIEAEVERGLRETTATLAAFPASRRMEYLRLLVEERQRLTGRRLAERIQHLRVVMQAIDATASADERGTFASGRGS
jgi:hypothetical protein